MIAPVIIAAAAVALIAWDVYDTVTAVIEEPTNPWTYVFVIGVIGDPTPGSIGAKGLRAVGKLFDRIPSSQVRKGWSEYYDWEWPKEPDGKNYHAHHIVELINGGDNSPTNIWPMPREEHIRLHKERDDFKNWGV